MVEARKKTNGPINANFFIFDNGASNDSNDINDNKAIESLKSLSFCQDIAFHKPVAEFYDLNYMLEPIWYHKPEILTFHLGIPSQDIIQKAHEFNICVGMTATNLQEGLAVKEAGSDFIVAQGIEAGGHRGIFFDKDDYIDSKLTTAELVVELVNNVGSTPVVAAGGIMNGSDIQAMLLRGASACQLGTVFLCCDESAASQAHKDYIINKHERGTTYTRSFSGRPAQGIRNDFMKMMEGKPVLKFPLQGKLTGPMRQLAVTRNEGEYQSLWTGREYAKVRPGNAATIMRMLSDEMKYIEWVPLQQRKRSIIQQLTNVLSHILTICIFFSMQLLLSLLMVHLMMMMMMMTTHGGGDDNDDGGDDDNLTTSCQYSTRIE